MSSVFGLVLVLSSLLGHLNSLNWQENLRPKLFFAMAPRDYTSFSGESSSSGSGRGKNASSTSSAFTLLFVPSFVSPEPRSSSINSPVADEPPSLLLIGAENMVYKLSSTELRLTQTLLWHSSDTDRESCLVKGKKRDACQNYVSVIQQFEEDPNRYMICGTNAFKPMCREYVDERGSYIVRDERKGLGLAPFDPAHNSTAVLVGEELYAGTVADFTGVDSIIFRKPLRTQQYDSVQLNSPDFVGSFEHQDFVYFFFREPAVEHINCGKSVFSRVARVCKNDQGGPNKARHTWTSFLKTRLNCSVPGEFPFYFDEIQGITPLVKGIYGQGPMATNKKDNKKNNFEEDMVLYATFTTPVNSIGASAVCAFRLRDISDAFAGRFKEQRSVSANWLPVEDHKVPSTRPGTCINDTKTLSDQTMNFIKTHSLMDEPVRPFFGAPVVIRTGLTARFTVIAVDPQVKTTDGKTYDVLFVGTTNGRVIKTLNAKSAESRSEVVSVVIEELQVFSADVVIKDVKVLSGGRQGLKSLGRLAVMSRNEVRSFPVQRCDRATTCQECVALQDPYCAWEIRSSRCSSGDWTENMATSFIQSVATGRHGHCPSAKPSPESQVISFESYFSSARLGQVVNIVDESRMDDTDATGGQSQGGSRNSYSESGSSGGSGVQVVETNQVLFSLETLIITVSAGAVAALVLGFVTGYCCGRRCRKDDGMGGRGHPGLMPYPDTEYEYFEQRGGLARPTTTLMTTPHPSLGAPLLPQQAAKINDGREEEVTYAEPELVTGLSHRLGGPPSSVGSNGPPLNLGSNNMSALGMPQTRFNPVVQQSSVPSGATPQPPLPGTGSHYSSSLLNPANKFNTIHSGGKRPLPSINQYESAAEAKLGSGKDPAYYARGRDNVNQYHMSTLGRTSSMRTKDPLLEGRSAPGGGGGSNGSSSNDNSSAGKGQQVVDSAYGTTRSVKKVYL